MAASVQFAGHILLVAAIALLNSPAALSQGCGSGDLAGNFTNCEDLPTLGASLHWTYAPAASPNPTLSVAFTAAPAGPNGWVAWGLNPDAQNMVGTQALLAFKTSGGSFAVKTYNITAHGPITESPILYGVSKQSAQSSGGSTTIFATLALPQPITSINHVWQVGSTVVSGVPQAHAMLSANFGSVGSLALQGTAAPSGSPPVTPSGSPPVTPSGSPPVTPSGSPSFTPSGSPSLTPTGSPSAPRPGNSVPPPSPGSGAGVLGSTMWVFGAGVLTSLGFYLF